MLYKRSIVEVAKRSYTYDNLTRPVTRVTQREGNVAVTDSFAYNGRGELSAATVNNGAYGYAYDIIGNRKTAQEVTEEITTYAANTLNQYTAITAGEEASFAPTFDASGNQT